MVGTGAAVGSGLVLGVALGLGEALGSALADAVGSAIATPEAVAVGVEDGEATASGWLAAPAATAAVPPITSTSAAATVRTAQRGFAAIHRHNAVFLMTPPDLVPVRSI